MTLKGQRVMAKPPEEVRPPTTSSGRTVPVRLVVAGAITVLALFFVFQNTGNGRVSLLFWSFEAPTWAWIALTFAGGIVVGSIFPWLRRRRP